MSRHQLSLRNHCVHLTPARLSDSAAFLSHEPESGGVWTAETVTSLIPMLKLELGPQSGLEAARPTPEQTYFDSISSTGMLKFSSSSFRPTVPNGWGLIVP
eukprot:gene2482-biopygen11492